MNLKITLRLLNKDHNNQKSLDLGNTTYATIKPTHINPSVDEEVFDFCKSEHSNHYTTIADVIISICQQKKICPDTMQLYFITQSNIKLLKDNDNVEVILSNKDQSIQNKEQEIPKCENIILYHTINNTKIKISVDLYQMKIDKIYLKLACNCSILMLKHIISSKLNKIISPYEQKIFGLSLLFQGNKVKKINLNSKEFNDELKLNDIIKTYDNNYNESNITNYVIHFLLSRNTNNKLQMGLNFKFNYFKNITKIPFKENAPKHCECSDGLNLFCYCYNNECSLYNQLFVHILGYGCFEIIKESSRLKCPICNNTKNIELKNIGLINAKWFYKGMLNAYKTNVFEGDGITVDHQLYIMQEVKMHNLVHKLYIDVKPYFAKEDNTAREKSENKGEIEIDVEECDLDDISLLLPNERKGNNVWEKEFVLEDINGAKLINDDEDFRSMDVMLDGNEKNICDECINNNDCSVF